MHEAMNNILAAKTAENEEAQARMAEFGEAGNSGSCMAAGLYV